MQSKWAVTLALYLESEMWYNIRMTLADIQEKARPILEQHNAREAYVFGSAARDEARADSDIDILARFDHIGGLFGYMRIKHDLEDALGRTVDLVQMEALKPEFKAYVDKDKVRIL